MTNSNFWGDLTDISAKMIYYQRRMCSGTHRVLKATATVLVIIFSEGN